VAAAGPAAAQSTENSTIAESLFRDAQARLAAGDLTTACDLFARSQRVEAALGTLLNLAACHERDGKTATAWTEFENALSWAVRNGDRSRQDYARSHASALEGRLHRVVIEIETPVDGMQVLLDSAPLPRDALGTAIPLDPGEHTIQVTAPDRSPWLRKINLGPAAGTDRIEVKLEAVGQPAPAPADAPPPATAPDRPAPPPIVTAPATAPPAAGPAAAPPSDGVLAPPPAETSRDDGKRIAGFVVGGVGVAALGTAIGLGAAMAHDTSSRDSLCPAGTPCSNQRAFDEDHAARLDQQWMLVTGGVAVAALAVGVVLIVTSHSPSKAAVLPTFGLTADRSGGQVGLEGRW
jgi:hypothetical protein